jgi:hypothetical protein
MSTGNHRSVPLDGKKNVAGTTPTTVCGRSFSVIVVPTTLSIDPRDSRQNRSLITS